MFGFRPIRGSVALKLDDMVPSRFHRNSILTLEKMEESVRGGASVPDRVKRLSS